MASLTAPRRKSNRRNRSSRQKVEWVAKDQTKKLFRLALYGVAAVFIGVAGSKAEQWLSDPANLPIRHVAVLGQLPHMDVEALREDIRAKVSGGFFGLNLDEMRESLEMRPWVYQASVRRQWPDRLEIHIEEQNPIARWGDRALLNKFGETFPSSQAELRLPLIQGEDGREEELISVFVNSDKLLRTVGLDLVELHEDARHNQTLTLSDGIEISLGRRDQNERLRRFVTAYNDTLEGFVDRIEKLDLRYTNGFSVGWRSEGTGLIGS